MCEHAHARVRKLDSIYSKIIKEGLTLLPLVSDCCLPRLGSAGQNVQNQLLKG